MMLPAVLRQNQSAKHGEWSHHEPIVSTIHKLVKLFFTEKETEILTAINVLWLIINLSSYFRHLAHLTFMPCKKVGTSFVGRRRLTALWVQKSNKFEMVS